MCPGCNHESCNHQHQRNKMLSVQGRIREWIVVTTDTAMVDFSLVSSGRGHFRAPVTVPMIALLLLLLLPAGS